MQDIGSASSLDLEQHNNSGMKEGAGYVPDGILMKGLGGMSTIPVGFLGTSTGLLHT